MTPKDDDKYTQQVLFTNRGLAFQSNAWWNFDLHIVQLTHVFRQDDEELVALLNRMRKGQITDEDLHFMNREFYHQAAAEAAVDALHLYPKNDMVEKRNKECLDRLDSPLEKYECKDFVWPYDGDFLIPMPEEYSGPFNDNRERRNIYLLQNNWPFYRARLASQNRKGFHVPFYLAVEMGALVPADPETDAYIHLPHTYRIAYDWKVERRRLFVPYGMSLIFDASGLAHGGAGAAMSGSVGVAHFAMTKFYVNKGDNTYCIIRNDKKGGEEGMHASRRDSLNVFVHVVV
jgi:hypothetical protein